MEIEYPDRPRVIVCGTRTFRDRDLLRRTLDPLVATITRPVILVGDARGADTLGWEWAGARGFTRKRFEADWKNKSRSAGYIRNEEMVMFAIQVRPAYCVAFWDDKSPGTEHTIELAIKFKLYKKIIHF